jgi:hypothetical protein
VQGREFKPPALPRGKKKKVRLLLVCKRNVLKPRYATVIFRGKQDEAKGVPRWLGGWTGRQRTAVKK